MNLEQSTKPSGLSFPCSSSTHNRKVWQRLVTGRYVYMLILPGFIYFAIFKFLPMWGVLIAFQNYNPFVGISGSEWVGFEHFSNLFLDKHFYILLRNTLLINLMSLIFFFPLPILLSVMLNEVRHEWFMKLNQSIVYMPHFLSWVVVASMTFFTLSVDVGFINKLLISLGMDSISFLSEPKFFWGILTLQNIWKETGWGTIIFLAAVAGVDPQRYEAAVVDGAGRLRQIWHITLPAIRPTIVILLILRLGHMADVGFEQVLLMMNPLVNDVADVFDTYVYYRGIQQGDISIGTAVGMFKGVVGLILVLISNYVVKKLGHEGIY
ncbi:putative aldouronate transport system permease protein [Paenibacillus sp. 1_12]|uniref:ABC transporter permease n=1 Tax=Paenibacillus sp. 1_12 TaxID=1566278 RepID=UPI0008E7C026|nr:ABC transporter permease subunit [Paenibacillus sp. 1_12]SFL01105.1 putative aldouronate transport system permease protein [Paenibacillus sp. 1_12]